MAIRKGTEGSKEEGGAKVSKGDGGNIRNIKNYGAPDRVVRGPDSPDATKVGLKK